MSKKAQKEINDAVVLFEQAYYVVPCYDNETGNTEINIRPCPSFTSVRRLKGRRADYRPGKVKVYTEQEVRQYELELKALHPDD